MLHASYDRTEQTSVQQSFTTVARKISRNDDGDDDDGDDDDDDADDEDDGDIHQTTTKVIITHVQIAPKLMAMTTVTMTGDG